MLDKHGKKFCHEVGAFSARGTKGLFSVRAIGERWDNRRFVQTDSYTLVDTQDGTHLATNIEWARETGHWVI